MRLLKEKNIILIDMINAMFLSSGAPKTFEEKLFYLLVTFLIYFHEDSNMTPYEFWKKRSPGIGYLKVWGCLAKIVTLELKKRKIGFKTADVVYIGYVLDSNTNRFFGDKF